MLCPEVRQIKRDVIIVHTRLLPTFNRELLEVRDDRGRRALVAPLFYRSRSLRGDLEAHGYTVTDVHRWFV